MVLHDARGRMRTEGRRLLCAAVAASRGRDVAQQLRISRSHLSSLLAGERRPSLNLAIRIEVIFSISPRTWSL